MKHLHLLVSTFIIIPTAIVYGLLPNGILKDIFHFNFEQVDLANIFKAMMGLYIGMAIFWLVGISQHRFWISATLSNILFMAGLAVGRVLGFLFDGKSSSIFIIAFIGEVILAAWGIVNLRKYKS